MKILTRLCLVLVVGLSVFPNHTVLAQFCPPDDTTIKVYDQKDITVFGTPSLGAKPIRVIQVEDD